MRCKVSSCVFVFRSDIAKPGHHVMHGPVICRNISRVVSFLSTSRSSFALQPPKISYKMSHSTAQPLGDSTNTYSTPTPARNPSGKHLVDNIPSNATIDIFSPIPSVPSVASPTPPVDAKRQRVESIPSVTPAIIDLTDDDDQPVESTSIVAPGVIDLTDLDDKPIPKTAGQLLYETPELFRRVLDFASSRSLARMLCCEKRITAIVADVLYHEVTMARISKMSRKGRT